MPGFFRKNHVWVATTLVGALSLGTAFYEATRPLPVPPPPAPPEHTALLPDSPPQPVTDRAGKAVMPDLTSNPLAGTAADFSIAARDTAGQTGVSAPLSIDLPAYPFTQPVARVLARLRLALALDVTQAGMVARDITSILDNHVDLFPDMSTYFSLGVARDKLLEAKTPEAIMDVQAQLWGVMQTLEIKALTKAEQALREAERALDQAMTQKTTPQEINRLRENLEKKLEDYLKEQAQQQNRQKPNSAPTDEQIAKDMQDIHKTLDEMSKADTPDAPRDAARALEQSMEQLLQKMQKQQQQRQAEQQAKQQAERQKQAEAQKQAEEKQKAAEQINKDLKDLIKEQQALRDRTAQSRQDGQHQQDSQSQDSQSQDSQPQDMQKNLDAMKQQLQRQQQMQQQMQQMQKSQKELQELIKKQQALQGDTFKKSQLPPEQQQDQQQQPAPGEQQQDQQQQPAPGGQPQDQQQQPEPGEQQQDQQQQPAPGGQPQDQQQQPAPGGQPQDQQQQPEPGEQQQDQQQQPAPGGQPQDQQQQPAPGGQPQSQQQLSQRQGGLKQQLDTMIDQLGQKGVQTKALPQAGRQMGQSQDQLNNTQNTPSVETQGKIIQSLKDGAKELQQKMDQMKQGQSQGQDQPGQPGGSQPGQPGSPGQGDGDGQGQGTGNGRSSNAPRDSYGPQGETDNGDQTVVPDEAAKNQADAIQKQLREQLSNPGLSQEQRDYNKRLLGNGRQQPQPPQP